MVRGPIHSLFSMVVNGLISIRAYNKFEFFKTQFLNEAEIFANVTFTYVVTNKWLGFRFDCCSAFRSSQTSQFTSQFRFATWRRCKTSWHLRRLSIGTSCWTRSTRSRKTEMWNYWLLRGRNRLTRVGKPGPYMEKLSLKFNDKASTWFWTFYWELDFHCATWHEGWHRWKDRNSKSSI